MGGAGQDGDLLGDLLMLWYCAPRAWLLGGGAGREGGRRRGRGPGGGTEDGE